MKQTKRQLLAASLAALMLMSQTGVITYAASEDSTGSSATETATTATVSSLAELQTALADSNITQITITDTLSLTSGTDELKTSDGRSVKITSTLIGNKDIFSVSGEGSKLTLGEGLNIETTGGGVLWAENGGEIVVGEGTVINDSGTAGSSAAVVGSAKNGGILTVDGGFITGNGTDVVLNTATTSKSKSTINFKRGTLTATNSNAIGLNYAGELNVTGGTIKCTAANYSAIYSREGVTNIVINITGGTIISENAPALDCHTGSTTTIKEGENGAPTISGTSAIVADGGNITVREGVTLKSTTGGEAVAEGERVAAGTTQGAVNIDTGVIVVGTIDEDLLPTDSAIVTDENGKTVVGIAVTGVTLDKTTAEIAVGETATLTATVKPDDATNQTVTWTSDKPAVATVVDGEVEAVAAGTATITATTSNGKTATCTVTVTEAEPEVFNKSAADFTAGTVVTQTKKVKADDGETMSYRFVMKITEAQAEAATKATFAISNGATTVNKDVTVCYTSIVAGGNTVSEDGYVYVAYTVTGVPTTVELSATITLS